MPAPPNSSLAERCAALVADLELGGADAVRDVVPLTGGVASDIARFELAGNVYCAKFALSKLRVAEDWQAPVHRNRAEYAWLECASDIEPASAVKLFGHSRALNGFVMEYIEGEDVFLWKERLLTGGAHPEQAAAVGSLVGRIHAASCAADFSRQAFDNADDFHALRLEPYLLFTATRHPAVKPVLERFAASLHQSRDVLVHGDVSPKNILFRGGSPLILDAECATLGDGIFDLAFCLNHLVLKSIHLPASRRVLLDSVHALWRAYRPHIRWEDPGGFETRLCGLIPALMLARVDGKSPVEYLDEAAQDRVRQLSLAMLESPCGSLGDFTSFIFNNTGTPHS